MVREATGVYFARLLLMNDNSTANSAIREFVQQHLGCRCPDEVFDNIGISDGSRCFDTDSTLYQIGGRLLVAVLTPRDWQQVCAGLERLVDAGKRMRDQEGYNRFRLVVATVDRDADSLLHHAFNDCRNADDRVHLHVIHPRLLPSHDQVHH